MMSNKIQAAIEYGVSYEEKHVHTVYEEIASNFSATRYKPWPIVERFLMDQPYGAIGADVGCGNGKYLTVNPNVFIVGTDRSTKLIEIARKHEPHSTVVADNLHLPHPDKTFDFAISIAVVHHLSTSARRVEAVRQVLNLLREPTEANPHGGRALFYVWALEQKDSRRGWDEGHEQDVMVPWVLKQKGEKFSKQRRSDHSDALGAIEPEGNKRTATDKTFLRYYHLYKNGELESDIVAAGGLVIQAGYEKDNWWVVAGTK
ncbi:tRNA methyltransferase, has a role in tRNA modification [Coniothyrium glycines]